MSSIKKSIGRVLFYGLMWCCIVGLNSLIFGQTVTVNGGGGTTKTGRTFDGVGGVSGGGATSALLMSYPEPYRAQILDYLFKPKFGASIQTCFCEVPGDANSTQGSESSHMHSANDQNYQRGYEWFIMKEAFKRNPAITFDAVAWGCPHWVGAFNFWSTDMQNYYVNWIKGLKSNYGIDLDAIGCRNESGSNTSWLIQFRGTLDNAGLSKVRIHGMDDWQDVQAKWGTADQLSSNASLNAAIDVLSAHTTVNTTWSETKIDATANAINSGKPLWDTEEHYMTGANAMNSGYKQATAEVQAFNQNYIRSKVTKTLFWYLIDCTYPLESYADYGCMTAKEPWSGYYVVKEGVWGFAHYNQFVKVGWQYIDGACGNINNNANNGSYVALRAPDNSDFSVIVETKYATATQNLTFNITGGLPTNKPLCVWRSTGTNDMFVKQTDIPAGASFSISLNANSIYSISTTTGQQKGAFSTPIPASKQLTIPYYDNFDHYTSTEGDQKLWGYYAYNFADICGVFEIANRPDGTGKCLRQVLSEKANGWAPEGGPFTIIGSRTWTDYEVSADVYFDNNGWAAVMGRISGTMNGYGAYPQGYRLRLASNGAWGLYYANGAEGDGTSLASGSVTLTGTWHNIKLRMSGSTLTCFIENQQVTNPAINNSQSGNGLAGLGTGSTTPVWTSSNQNNPPRNTAMFDNFIINTPGGAPPSPTIFSQDANPPYSKNSVTIEASPQPMQARVTPVLTSYKVFGSQFVLPKELIGKTIAVTVYDLKGTLVQKVVAKGTVVPIRNGSCKSNEAVIVKLRVAD